MIQSIRQPRRYALFTGLALAAQLGNLLLSEYFYLVDFLRPLLLWLVLAGREGNSKKRAVQALRY